VGGGKEAQRGTGDMSLDGRQQQNETFGALGLGRAGKVAHAKRRTGGGNSLGCHRLTSQGREVASLIGAQAKRQGTTAAHEYPFSTRWNLRGLGRILSRRHCKPSVGRGPQLLHAAVCDEQLGQRYPLKLLQSKGGRTSRTVGGS